ncbi:MAG: serine/threonine-protein kinase [Myxococcota bacterium]
MADQGSDQRSSDGRRAGSFAPPNSPLARAPTAAFPSGSRPPVGASSDAPVDPRVPLDARGKPAFGPVRRFGPYTLVKKLATGGMAEIWLARQRGAHDFAKFLAVKKILAHLAEQPAFVNMFMDEARTCSQLSHPNIVHIHDFGRAEGTYFIAMEYIAGENLAAIAWRGVKRGRPFPPALAAKVVADASKALHYAHTLRGDDGRPLSIVHRDVSPQNLLVTYEGEVKVVDFGIAKANSRTEHTKTGMLKGKFSYMSPEQCVGAPVDHRSDIFALGILLYELCTGKRLFKHESELMILEMITKRQVVAPSEVSPNISPDLERIILKALQKDPNARFQSAQAMQLALEDHLRRHPHPINDAAISEYMRTLFADRIEEKRRLRERASRSDFEDMFLDAEATESRGAVPHGSTPGPALYTGAEASAHLAEPPPSSALTQLLTILAVVIIVIAGTVLVYLFSPQEAAVTLEAHPTPVEAPAPLRTGELSLESSPPGAVIHLDGQPMRLAGGGAAQTPSDLTGLQYGRKYLIALKKEGYRVHTLEIAMGEGEDGRSHHPTLEPFPGRLITEVRELDAAQVEIFYDGKSVGQGPQVVQEVPGNTTVLVEAKLDGKICKAQPPRVRVLPNRTISTEVSCKVPTPARTRPPRAAQARVRRTTPSRGASRGPTPSANRGDCTTNPNLAPGLITIDTEPYATIYYGREKLGETPISSKRLPAGCVELRAVTASGKSRTVKVEVEPNMTRIYRFKI